MNTPQTTTEEQAYLAQVLQPVLATLHNTICQFKTMGMTRLQVQAVLSSPTVVSKLLEAVYKDERVVSGIPAKVLAEYPDLLK